LPKGQEKRQDYALTVGRDGAKLLEAVYDIYDIKAPQWLRLIPGVEILRQVWLQQYRWTEQGLQWRSEQDGLPPSKHFIASPYDTQLRPTIRRPMTQKNAPQPGWTAWLGYKVHLSETCDEEAPHLITHVETTLAPVVDRESLPPIHQALKAKDLLPGVHLADTGYIDARSIIESQADYGVDLLGPTLSDYHWQAKAAQGFAASDFALDWDQKRAACPKGQVSYCWTPFLDKNQQTAFKVQFSQALCRHCEAKSQLHVVHVEPCWSNHNPFMKPCKRPDGVKRPKIISNCIARGLESKGPSPRVCVPLVCVAPVMLASPKLIYNIS